MRSSTRTCRLGFIDEHTTGFDVWWEVVQDYAPNVEEVTGVDPETIRQAARHVRQRRYGHHRLGMGVTQQAQGVQTVRALAALAMITGHIGTHASGLAPVRGQNNVQGSCDMGMWPSLYPGYQRVDDPAVRAKFAKGLGCRRGTPVAQGGFQTHRPAARRGRGHDPRVLQLR